ncbi:MAG: phosphoadenylyl-sulfate reductase [Bacteroidota bacterium]
MTRHIKAQLVQAATAGTELDIDQLNELFTPLSYRERIGLLYHYFDQDKVLYTSSFGTKSVFLLHLIHQLRPTQPVHFIDTTYHFQETLDYRDQLQDLLNLEIINVLPGDTENALTRDEQWWIEHPKMCCSINKVVPLEPIIACHKVWISGLIAHETDFRSRLRVFERQGDIIKFHPLIDIDQGEMLYHIGYHQLPAHPLQEKGYGSIGCAHCTAKGEGRSGRWKGTAKTECGLHPSYFTKKK